MVANTPSQPEPGNRLSRVAGEAGSKDAAVSTQPGPRNWLCHAAGAGLQDAALLRAVQTCTAGVEPRHTAPSEGGAPREAGNVGAPLPKQGPQDRLCRTAGAATPSGGSEPRETGSLGAIYRGRFAPSPTGPLHAGSLVAALASWLDARAHSGRWLVRIEDVDTPRCMPAANQIILEQLAACGLVPDELPVYQSQRGSKYQKALDRLVQGGLAYPCGCTRHTIAKALAASGQCRQRHGELVYPGTCRQGLNGQPARAWRFRTVNSEQNMLFSHIGRVPAAIDLIVNQVNNGFEAQIFWHDRHLGPQSQNVCRDVGDFVLRRADGLWAYQLAVVVDDAAQNITHVVRGADLTDNTARQILLQHALGLPTPHYLHTPLVRGADGEKLSKQNGAQALDLHDPLLALSQAAQVLGLRGQTGLATDALTTWVHAWRDTMSVGGQLVELATSSLAHQSEPTLR